MGLEIKGLSKSFDGDGGFQNVSLIAEEGEILGIVGKSGSGKTTALRCILNILSADRGEVLFEGRTFDPIKEKVGFLSQEKGLYDDEKVLDQLIYFGQLKGYRKRKTRTSVKEWLELVGLEEYENTKLKLLPIVDQQKIQLCQAFINEPKIIFLDEPFKGLSRDNEEILKMAFEKVRENKGIIILTSSQGELTESFCDRIVPIEKRKAMETVVEEEKSGEEEKSE